MVHSPVKADIDRHKSPRSNLSDYISVWKGGGRTMSWPALVGSYGSWMSFPWRFMDL